MKCNLFSYFFNTQPELKINLLADDVQTEIDEKSLKIQIKHDERALIEDTCAKLETIIAKLESAIIQKPTQLKTRFALISTGFAGLTAGGFARLVQIAQQASLSLNQMTYNFSHLIVNNSTCAESIQENVDYYCPPKSVSIAEDMVQVISAQGSALVQNTTALCQQIQRDYCDMNDRRGGMIFAAILVGLSSLSLLTMAARYGCCKRTDPDFMPSWVISGHRVLTRQVLNNQDIRFLEENTIHVNVKTKAQKTINAIRGKMLELRIKTTQYEPSLYNEIVHSYLSSAPEDKAAREFMGSFR